MQTFHATASSLYSLRTDRLAMRSIVPHATPRITRYPF